MAQSKRRPKGTRAGQRGRSGGRERKVRSAERAEARRRRRDATARPRGAGGGRTIEATVSCDRLSAQDRMFLALETAEAHMHIAATLIFKAGPLVRMSKAIDFKAISQYVGARLDGIPRYRQRVVRAPVTGEAFWLDDEHFNLPFHVRPAALPQPGGIDLLQRLSGRIMSEKLDRGKPLWEIHVVDGLQNGRFALISKTHHCMADGIAGAELLAALLSPNPKEKMPAAAPWSPRGRIGGGELLRRSLAEVSSVPPRFSRRLFELASSPARLRAAWKDTAVPLWETLRTGLNPAPPTPLNVPIGPHRRFAWLALELADVKAIKNSLGGTVNDVVLATVAGALRRFFKRRDPSIRLVDLRALVPVNMRTPSERGAPGNHVSAWLMPLPIQEWDPRRRFDKVRALSAEVKASNRAKGAAVLTSASDTLLSVGMRLAGWVRPFNLVVTNVPGPSDPLYLLGAPLEEVYPQVPLFPNQGLGIALFSYNGRIFWGFNADCHVLPDLDDFVAAVEASFGELLEAAHPLRAARFDVRSEAARTGTRDGKRRFTLVGPSRPAGEIRPAALPNRS